MRAAENPLPRALVQVNAALPLSRPAAEKAAKDRLILSL
jgi:hypothetical protein